MIARLALYFKLLNHHS